MSAEARPSISIVVPLYNEAENLRELHAQVSAALESTGRSFELILVDDGSTDATRARLLELEARDPRVVALLLRRNFGQTAAFSAGFDRSRGEIVVTSDGDLQNDPADIPALVARLEQDDLDMVCGWRRRRHDPLSKRIPSFFANRLISWATGVRLHDYGCSLKAMRGELARGLRLYGEMHRFIPAVASWSGVSLAELPVNHRPRTRGRSKYGIGRTTRVLLDLFTVKFLASYGTRPAHLFGLLGLGCVALGTAVMAYLAGLKVFLDEPIGGRPLLLLGALLFLTGVILVSFGLMGELLVRTWHESQGKAIYVVQERRRAAAGDAAQTPR
ncbi:MAG: glycosyltransferase family 2 protein [Betaproteobacteria bacterium]